MRFDVWAVVSLVALNATNERKRTETVNRDDRRIDNIDILFIAKPRGCGVLNLTILAKVKSWPEQPEIPVLHNKSGVRQVLIRIV